MTTHRICFFLVLLLTGLTLYPAEPMNVVHNTLAEIESVIGNVRLTLARTWGGDETEDEEQFFRNPMDIVVGKDGLIYICDFGNHRVQVFRDDGSYKRTIGRRGLGPADFINPFRLAVDRRGNLVVVDQSHCRIQVLTPAGKYITGFKVIDGWIMGLKAASKKNEIVTRSPKKTLFSRKLLFIYGQNGKPAREIGQYAHKIAGLGESEGFAFTIDSSDSLYTAFNATSYLLKYSYTGDLLMFMTYETPYETFTASWDSVKCGINIKGKAVGLAAYSLSVDDQGRIFIISQKRRHTKDELKNSVSGSKKSRNAGEVFFTRLPFESEKTDLLRLLVFASSGKIIAAADIDVYCDRIYTHGDRLFILDSFKAMKIYEYKVSFR